MACRCLGCQLRETEAEPNSSASLAADDFSRGARFGVRHAEARAERCGALSPLLDAAQIADRRGYDRGFAEALEAAHQIVNEVAEERRASPEVVLAEIRERIARRADGLRTGVHVVRGED